MRQPVMWINHRITVLPDGVEDEIKIWIEDLPRDKIGPLLDDIVRAGRAAMAPQEADPPEAQPPEAIDVAGGRGIAEIGEPLEARVEKEAGSEPEPEVPEASTAVEESRGGQTPSPPTPGVRRDWTREEDAVLRAAPTAAAAYELYCKRYPHGGRSRSSVKSRWYRVVKWAEDGDEPSYPQDVAPPDIGLCFGARVRIAGNGEFAGETGVVKRINVEANEVLVAIDGAPDLVWMPAYSVVAITGGDGS